MVRVVVGADAPVEQEVRHDRREVGRGVGDEIAAEAQLGAQVANTPQWGAELMDQHFDPVVLKLLGLLRKSLPGCAPEDIFWGYHFVTGALMLTLARTGRIDKLSDGMCKSDDFAAVKERMASFMAAGFIAICKDRAKGRKATK